MNQPSIIDMIAQLTRAHRHAEAYTLEREGTSYTQNHIVEAPALLHQLEHSSPIAAGERGRGGYGSRPAASIEAIDTLIRIDLDAARWVRDLGEDDPGNTILCVRFLGSLLPSTQSCGAKPTKEGTAITCCARHAIEHDIRRWWTQARIVSGWDTAAWKPNNTCPLCGVRGSIRIRIDGATDVSALCVECRETWDVATIPLLAEHIKAENHEDEAA